MANDPSKCPNCGNCMVQKFDYREHKGMTLATPNGKYSCRWCGYEYEKASQEQNGEREK